jgi:predicted phosphodiesterase
MQDRRFAIKNSPVRLAALYDVHGNLPALEAVLAELRTDNVDLVIIGGDVVPGPMPRETMTAVRELPWPTRFITGNGDRAVLAALRGDEPTSVPAAVRDLIFWNARQLAPADEDVIASWPATTEVEVAGLGTVLFCHATPRSDTDIFTRETPADRLAPHVDAGASLVVCGHTHMQFDRQVGATRVVNAGSVGMPFGAPGAYWLRIDGDAVQLRHTAYDLEAAAARVRRTSYPQADEFASRSILQPPTESDMLAAYARVQLR